MADLSGDPIEIPGLGEIKQEAEAQTKRGRFFGLWVWADAALTYSLVVAFFAGLFVMLGVIA